MVEGSLTAGKLDAFFTGLESGLNSLREVRSIYDEEVAFDFDPLRFFRIDENTITKMLAYFLDPKAKHGQKDILLRVFLKMVGAEFDLDSSNPITGSTTVSVTTQFRTSNGRPIDAVITFGRNDFIIAIENKVWNAVDQYNQIHDYVRDIEKKSNGQFLMLYLSPNGTGPSETSITGEELQGLGPKFKIIPFNRTDGLAIIPILKAFSDAARAENVRLFIKLMIKYLNSYFIGGKTVDEQKLITDYVRRHPGIIGYRSALAMACDRLKEEYIGALRLHVAAQLNNRGFVISRIQKRQKEQCDELFLQETPIWKGQQLPVVVQLEYGNIGRGGVVRIGVWSSDLELMKPLFESYQSNPDCKTEYNSNGAWQGGYFEVQTGFTGVDNVIEYFQNNEKFPDFSETYEDLQSYLSVLRSICAQNR